MRPTKPVLPQHHFFLQGRSRLLGFLSYSISNGFHLTDQLHEVRLRDRERLAIREHGLVLVRPEHVLVLHFSGEARLEAPLHVLLPRLIH